jgi:hypothetical protein
LSILKGPDNKVIHTHTAENNTDSPNHTWLLQAITNLRDDVLPFVIDITQSEKKKNPTSKKQKRKDEIEDEINEDEINEEPQQKKHKNFYNSQEWTT